MAPRNGSGFGTKFTVSIEAAEGVTTGISAADRARTVQAAAAKDAKAEDIVSPGHIFPLMAQPGGTLARAGHTEAACDLARMAGFEPSGVICEVMNDDGTMSRRAELEVFAAEHGLKIGTIADLIHYRMIHERTVQRIAEQPLDSELGQFNLVTYRDGGRRRAHGPDPGQDLRRRADPGARAQHGPAARPADGQAAGPLEPARRHGCRGRGRQRRGAAAGPPAGWRRAAGAHPRKRGRCTDQGTDHLQHVGAGSQILRDLGVRKMRLMSSPMKFNAISGFDLEVVEYVPSE
jgi:3,4-dihydroxy 2-butanone 4-phosphate synthase/GTP cyclohydrolase II